MKTVLLLSALLYAALAGNIQHTQTQTNLLISQSANPEEVMGDSLMHHFYSLCHFSLQFQLKTISRLQVSVESVSFKTYKDSENRI